ncbi:hypothetical protein HD806DRAFT_520986 [Xylariaceae sp. AK1471]|nr:hypothetical protein HD806DRAFT_520986 [Xylariaceae sp. AK1471]
MVSTFLDYLTLPNPTPNPKPCKEGTSTKISTVYGPHKVRPWTDFTWENLDASFGEVLRKQTDSPRIRDRDDVDSEQLTIYEEDSVTVLAQNWNMKVVQHALDGTRKTLMANHFKEYLAKGTLHLTKNTGQGHLPNEKGKLQKPDWCIYQKGQGNHDKAKFTYLVPGDSKPAKKWQSDWIECDDKPLRRKAGLVIQQLTKYMYLAQTRYGFIISEEELVPLRLSTFDRNSETIDRRIRDIHARQILGSTRGNFEEDDEDDEGYDRFEQGIGLQSFQELAEFLTEANNKTGFLLEYCRIPWTEHGDGMLTINLTLWWLPMLAIQNSSIEETKAYSPLGPSTGQMNRSLSRRRAANKVENESLETQASSHRKRKAQKSDQPEARSKSRRTSMNYNSGNQPTTSHSTPFPSRRSSRVSRDGAIPKAALDLSFPSGDMFNRRSSRQRNKGEGALMHSFTSVASSSQAPDSVAVSFASTLG